MTTPDAELLRDATEAIETLSTEQKHSAKTLAVVEERIQRGVNCLRASSQDMQTMSAGQRTLAMNFNFACEQDAARAQGIRTRLAFIATEIEHWRKRIS